MTMVSSYDYLKNFNTQVSNLTPPTTYGSNGGSAGGGFFGFGKKPTNVQDATNTGVFGQLINAFKSEKLVSVEDRGAGKLDIRVQDATRPTTGALLTNTLPERRYEATEVGNSLVLQERPNAGTGWWGQVTGNAGDGWHSSSWGEF